MAVGASAAGFGVGLRSGLASARQRRIDEEDLRRRRQREDLATEAAQFELNQARIDAPRRRAREDLQTDISQLELARQQRADAREPDDLARRRRADDLAYDTSTLALQNMRKSTERSDLAYNQSQRDLRLATEQQGMGELVYSLRKGVDPKFAAQRFNERGNLKLRDLQYDPTSGKVHVVDHEGDVFDGTLDQLEAAFGGGHPAPIKLGEKDRLIDSRTYQEIVPASDAGGDGQGNTGPGGARKTSPYNPETAQKDIEAGIVRSRGGAMDVLGNYSIANPEDRKLVDYMVGLGQGMEGRLRQHVSAGRITPGQIVDAVTDAVHEMPTESELAKRAEEWRTEPLINRSQEDAAAWMQTERQKQQAAVAAKLAAKEQEWLGQKGTPEKPAVTERPDWAGEPIPSAVIGDTKLEQGYEYDVNIDGRAATIRVAPNGQVYEVRGGKAPAKKPAAAAKPAPPANPAEHAGADPVASALEVARRNRNQFSY